MSEPIELALCTVCMRFEDERVFSYCPSCGGCVHPKCCECEEGEQPSALRVKLLIMWQDVRRPLLAALDETLVVLLMPVVWILRWARSRA
jgi:hypothetical protein